MSKIMKETQESARLCDMPDFGFDLPASQEVHYAKRSDMLEGAPVNGSITIFNREGEPSPDLQNGDIVVRPDGYQTRVVIKTKDRRGPFTVGKSMPTNSFNSAMIGDVPANTEKSLDPNFVRGFGDDEKSARRWIGLPSKKE